MYSSRNTLILVFLCFCAGVRIEFMASALTGMGCGSVWNVSLWNPGIRTGHEKENGEENETRNENGNEICRSSHGGRVHGCDGLRRQRNRETALRTAEYLRLQTVQGAVRETVQEILLGTAPGNRAGKQCGKGRRGDGE